MNLIAKEFFIIITSIPSILCLFARGFSIKQYQALAADAYLHLPWPTLAYSGRKEFMKQNIHSFVLSETFSSQIMAK